MLIDGDLNVMVQVNQGNLYPPFVVSPDGTFSQITQNYANGKFVSLTYGKDDKLYAVHTLNGHYINLWVGSPLASNADMTLSEVKLTPGGLTYTQKQQIFPFTSLSWDSRQLRCRNNYTIDTPVRYVPTGAGVLTIDSSGASPSISYRVSSQHVYALIYLGTDRPSNECFVSGEWMYYRNQVKDKIMRFSLTDVAGFVTEEVVSRTGIESFFIAGDRIHYSTGTRSYKANIDGSGDEDFSPQAGFSVNDLIEIR